MEPNVWLEARDNFCILRPGDHVPVNFPGKIRAKTTGHIGACILPDDILVPGVEVYFPNITPHIYIVPISAMKLLIK